MLNFASSRARKAVRTRLPFIAAKPIEERGRAVAFELWRGFSSGVERSALRRRRFVDAYYERRLCVPLIRIPAIFFCVMSMQVGELEIGHGLTRHGSRSSRAVMSAARNYFRCMKNENRPSSGRRKQTFDENTSDAYCISIRVLAANFIDQYFQHVMPIELDMTNKF